MKTLLGLKKIWNVIYLLYMWVAQVTFVNADAFY